MVHGGSLGVGVGLGRDVGGALHGEGLAQALTGAGEEGSRRDVANAELAITSATFLSCSTVSAMRGDSLPAHGSGETPLVTTAPSRATHRSTGRTG